MTPRPVESARFPYPPVRVRVGERLLSVEAYVDTGFEGDVALPMELADFDQAPDLLLRFRLADGSPVEAPGHTGTGGVGDLDPFPAEVAVVGREGIAGRAVADRYWVTLDRGGRVVVEP